MCFSSSVKMAGKFPQPQIVPCVIEFTDRSTPFEGFEIGNMNNVISPLLLQGLTEFKRAITGLYLMLKLVKSTTEEASGKKTSPECPDEIKEEESNDIKLDESAEKTFQVKEPGRQKNKQKQEDPSKPMKFLRPKPNFFIALPITEAAISEKVKNVQEKVISKNPILNPALVDISTLHITLAVTHLANKTDINNVKKKLDEWAAKNLKTYFSTPCVLSFKGINTFKNTVAYVDIEKCQNYNKLVDLSKEMNNVFSSAGYFTDTRSFTPHITVLKLSKNWNLLKKKKTFEEDFELMKNCTEFFGKQEIKHLQLLSMDEPKDENGYYKCYYEINSSINEERQQNEN